MWKARCQGFWRFVTAPKSVREIDSRRSKTSVRDGPPSTTPSPSTSSSPRQRNLRHRIMGRHRKKFLIFLSWLAHGLRVGGKRRPTADRSPAPQTSPSTSFCITSLGRTPIYPISLSQSSNSQMNLSFRSSLTSPQTHGSPVPTRGSVLRIAGTSVTPAISGQSFCDR